jgi:hypothetical protein
MGLLESVDSPLEVQVASWSAADDAAALIVEVDGGARQCDEVHGRQQHF